MKRLLALLLLCACTAPKPKPQNLREDIETFNRTFADATRKMDDEAILALWEEDGVCLLPKTPPLSGKSAIAAFLKGVSANLKGAKMESFDLSCTDIDVEGDLATEWCNEHQVVRLEGQPTFDGRGKLLLVLHRGSDLVWRLRREMWTE